MTWRAAALEHLAKVLGAPDETVKGPAGWDLVWFDDEPCQGARTIATVGLSAHEVGVGDGRQRCELVMMLRPDQVKLGEIVTVMDHFGAHLEGGHGLLKGSVHRISPGPFATAPEIVDFYVAHPAYLDHALWRSAESVLLWIVPLLPGEAIFERSVGWTTFERALTDADPDLLDLQRVLHPAFHAN